MFLEPDKDRLMRIAVANNDFEDVERLAPLGITNYYDSLRYAVFNGNVQMIKRIIELSNEYGVPLAAKEINYVAQEFNFPELNQIYIDLYHDSELDKNRMMYIAAGKDNFKEVERLAPLGITNYYDSLRHAVYSGSEKMIKRIIELSNEYGVPLTPKEISYVAQDFNFPKLVQIYNDINLKLDKDRMMRIAAGKNNFEVVERLAQLGITNYYDSLRHAVFSGSEQMIKRIIELSNEYGVPLTPKEISYVAQDFGFPKLVQIYNDVNERT